MSVASGPFASLSGSRSRRKGKRGRCTRRARVEPAAWCNEARDVAEDDEMEGAERAFGGA